MEVEPNSAAALEALSDEEYDRRVAEAVDTIMDRIEAAMRSDDPIETELLYAAAPVALRNMLALLIAEDCIDQPRPFKLVKQAVRELDLEGLALTMLRSLQAEAEAKTSTA